MGTSSLICVFLNNGFVIAQFSARDGYPEGQGREILKFLRVTDNIERLKNGLQHTYTIEEDESYEIETQWPTLSSTIGAHILERVAKATAEKRVPIELKLWFANDFGCEWAYVVDLDN